MLAISYKKIIKLPEMHHAKNLDSMVIHHNCNCEVILHCTEVLLQSTLTYRCLRNPCADAGMIVEHAADSGLHIVAYAGYSDGWWD